MQCCNNISYVFKCQCPRLLCSSVLCVVWVGSGGGVGFLTVHCLGQVSIPFVVSSGMHPITKLIS